MAPSASEIDALLRQSYAPSMVAPLEAYLPLMLSGEADYHANAVRTLVKLYQLFPSTSNETNIGYCCLLALLAYQNESSTEDLLAIGYLVPHPMTLREPLATIRRCADQLDACQFTNFWTSLAALTSSSDAMIALASQAAVPALQAAILSALALTYKTAPTSVVMESLHVNDPGQFTAHPAVASTDSTTVVFTAGAENTKRQRVFQEGVSFTTITGLLQKMAQH